LARRAKEEGERGRSLLNVSRFFNSFSSKRKVWLVYIKSLRFFKFERKEEMEREL
jgi:hypothetical protein